MAVNLTSRAISKIWTGECTSNDLKPVLQVIISDGVVRNISGKQWHVVMLSDGSFVIFGHIPVEIYISNKLQKGSIVQLTNFQLGKLLVDSNGEIIALGIEVYDLNLLRTTCDIIGDHYDVLLVPTISDEDHANSEEPSTSIQSPSTSTQKCSSHSSTQNKIIMGVNLTSGAISKIMTGKCTENDLKPVLQVTYIRSRPTRSKDGKKWYLTGLSDGSFEVYVGIAHEILISNKLQKGSIVQLTNFQLTKPIISYSKDEIIRKSGILVSDLTVIHTKCGIIGYPKLFLDSETPLVERTTPTISDEDHANSHHVEEPPTSKQKQDHVDSLLHEDIDDSRHVDEPPTSKQKPSTSTQKCSSHSSTQNKKRKLQTSDDAISGFGKDISKLVSMIVEKTIEDVIGACHEKLGTLEEGVSNMTRMMMEKNKENDVGFKKIETLEQDVSMMMKLTMEKNKEVDAGFIKLEALKEDVSQMAKMVMEKIKEVDVGFKKLETLEENVSKMTRMMMERKEDDMGACIEKLDKMGWGAEEPIYDTALLLFLKGADYRKLWLHLKPECCGKWVKISGSIFGLLD